MVDLEELRSRITAEIPPAYVEYVNSKTADELREQGFDPKTLLVLNLELATLEDSPENAERFYLTGDGCGNYYFVDCSLDEDLVMLWDHETMDIEDTDEKLSEYLPTLEQCNRIDEPVRFDSGQLYICRTALPWESILDPIELEEWLAAVKETVGIEFKGFTEAVNPFTKEVVRFDRTGYSVVATPDGEQGVHYFQGHISMANNRKTLKSIALKLAEALAANVVDGT